MTNQETTGAAVNRLRDRAGLSLRALAAKAGYAAASSIQRYADPAFDSPLGVEVATRFADAMQGQGDPPIARAEILALTGLVTDSNAVLFRMEGSSVDRMQRDLPIYGTALGADEIVDGEAIEQTTLNRGEVVEYKRRPPILDGRADVYGLYVQGSSMHPRFRDGDTVFVESRKRPAVGDDAVIYLRTPDEVEGERTSSVLIKTIVRKTASYVELEQFNPAQTFRITMERVDRMDRVLTLDDLIG
ncbi:S24 family peptidase [Sphingomonas sp. ASY06-1R]|uniref:S24 family peptidase n=1 Tax=Sphingomonas sp. ASY06-1R TaxID=3445771 RepID=UPI003FA1D5C0